jgi:hypothetical protein
MFVAIFIISFQDRCHFISHCFNNLQVKGALLRTLALPESADKHAQIQLLAGLISTMIDNCPSTPNNTPLSASLKLHQYRYFTAYLLSNGSS